MPSRGPDHVEILQGHQDLLGEAYYEVVILYPREPYVKNINLPQSELKRVESVFWTYF